MRASALARQQPYLVHESNPLGGVPPEFATGASVNYFALRTSDPSRFGLARILRGALGERTLVRGQVLNRHGAWETADTLLNNLTRWDSEAVEADEARAIALQILSQVGEHMMDEPVE